MTDQTQTPPTDPGAPPANGAPPPPAPGEGAYDYPKWRDGLKDAELKAWSEKYHSFEDILRSDKQSRKEMSDRIRLPGPNATAEDMGKFRKALGVPDTPEGYVVSAPDGVTLTDADKALFDIARPIAHESNLSAKEFSKMMLKFVEAGQSATAEVEKFLKDAATAGQAELRQKWSTDYDKNRELAFRTVAFFGGEELKKALESAAVEGFGRMTDWPPFLELMAAIGKRADGADMQFDGGQGGVRQGAQQELEQLLDANPPGSDGYKKNQPRIQELYGIIHGKKPITGASGRTT